MLGRLFKPDAEKESLRAEVERLREQNAQLIGALAGRTSHYPASSEGEKPERAATPTVRRRLSMNQIRHRLTHGKREDKVTVSREVYEQLTKNGGK